MGSQGGDSIARVRFTRALARLKHEGCAILVVGEKPASIQPVACTRLLGEDSLPHERVVVRTAEATIAELTHGPLTTEIRYWPSTREGATKVPNTEGRTPPATTLVELSDRLSCEITRAAAAINTSSEGSLRLCVDSLSGLRANHTEQELLQFLRGVIAELTAVDGIGHFHLATSVTIGFVKTLRPLFDTLLNLRASDEGIEQRWWLAETESWTEWFPL